MTFFERAEFPEATIFRPADVYGGGDSFINFWFSMMRKTVKSGISLYGKVHKFILTLTGAYRKCI